MQQPDTDTFSADIVRQAPKTRSPNLATALLEALGITDRQIVSASIQMDWKNGVRVTLTKVITDPDCAAGLMRVREEFKVTATREGDSK